MKLLILPLIFCVAALFALSACSKAPDNLGHENGRLAPCPETANCVSSQATDKEHHVDPIQATGHEDTVIIRLRDAIESMFGSKIITIDETYIRAEFTSRIFRFVDDLECFYDKANGRIEVRSASRIGYSDLGANRQRVEDLRAKFTEQ